MIFFASVPCTWNLATASPPGGGGQALPASGAYTVEEAVGQLLRAYCHAEGGDMGTRGCELRGRTRLISGSHRASAEGVVVRIWAKKCVVRAWSVSAFEKHAAASGRYPTVTAHNMARVRQEKPHAPASLAEAYHKAPCLVLRPRAVEEEEEEDAADYDDDDDDAPVAWAAPADPAGAPGRAAAERAARVAARAVRAEKRLGGRLRRALGGDGGPAAAAVAELARRVCFPQRWTAPVASEAFKVGEVGGMEV